MKPYAELLEFNQPNLIRREGFTRIRDSFELLKTIDVQPRRLDTYVTHDPERIIEFAGRWDYGEKNAQKLGQKPIIEKWLESGEESMIEMAHATFFIECSRVVSHELVRHRLASFQQESQRFTKYEDMNLQEWDDAMYYPDGLKDVSISPSDYSDDNADEMLYRSYRDAYYAYRRLREEGVAPQLARYVLPNAMRTRMIVSANLREWRHILKLRLHNSAQPEMRELMEQVYEQLNDVFPTLMKGIKDGERGVR